MTETDFKLVEDHSHISPSSVLKRTLSASLVLAVIEFQWYEYSSSTSLLSERNYIALYLFSSQFLIMIFKHILSPNLFLLHLIVRCLAEKEIMKCCTQNVTIYSSLELFVKNLCNVRYMLSCKGAVFRYVSVWISCRLHAGYARRRINFTLAYSPLHSSGSLRKFVKTMWWTEQKWAIGSEKFLFPLSLFW